MDIESINIGEGLALTDSGQVLEIDVYLDADGDECERNDDVHAGIVQMPDGLWAVIAMSDYARATEN